MGYLLALVTALLLATSDVLTRRLFQVGGTTRAREAAVLRLLLALPVLLAALPFVSPPPAEVSFWWIVAVGAPLEVLALVLYVRAIRISPLSVSLPLLATTPALVLVTGPLLAGDPFSAATVPGVLLIATGGYLLNLAELRRGWSGPWLALVRDGGARMMFLVALIYAVTSALGKRGVVLSSPGTMAAYYFVAVALVGIPALAPRPAELRRLLAGWPVLVVAIGITFTVHLFTHMAAVSLMPAAEMIALKRTSLLFASVAGVALLGEPNPPGRLAGAGLMVAGAIWIGFV